MNLLRVSLRKSISMLGGGVSAILVMITVCFCACGLNGVFHSDIRDAIHLDVIVEQEDAYTREICRSMETSGSIVIRYVDEKAASGDLVFGRTEGVLFLPKEFSQSVAAGEPAYTYRSAASSASSSFVLEQLSTALLSIRLRENLIDYAAQDGEPYEQARDRVSAAWEHASTQIGSGYTMSVSNETRTDIGRGVFQNVYAKSNGFTAMLLLFLYSSALQWLILEDVKQVRLRLFSRRNGILFGNGTDVLALLMIGAVFSSACGALLGTLSIRYAVFFLCYYSLLSGGVLLLSGMIRTDGQVQLFVPFVTLITGLAGGCLFDLSSVSPIWQKAALFTPQGLLLNGMDTGSWLPATVLASLGAICFLISLSSQHRSA